jgi:phosphohistidine swiveling domain-containing protein
LVDTDASPETLEELERAALGRRKKAEYSVEQAVSAVGGLKGGNLRKRADKFLLELRRHSKDAAVQWVTFEQLIALLRATMLSLGERLFEHGLIDQPRDVLQLEVGEVAGLIRGTGVDADVRPLVAARKRTAVADPADLSKRLETRGVVATSLLTEEASVDELSLGNSLDGVEIKGRGVSSGEVRDSVTVLDTSVPVRSSALRSVLVTKTFFLRMLPLAVASRAVIAERGTAFGPGAYMLRALGIPALVDARNATTVFSDGALVRLDAARGVARRVVRTDAHIVVPSVDPHAFAREAVASDPRLRTRASRPAATLDELEQPPLVRPLETPAPGAVPLAIDPPPTRIDPASAAPVEASRRRSIDDLTDNVPGKDQVDTADDPPQRLAPVLSPERSISRQIRDSRSARPPPQPPAKRQNPDVDVDETDILISTNIETDPEG